MTKMKNSFEYKLQGELLYHKEGAGDLVKAKKIEIKAPTNKHKKEVFKIELEYEKAQIEYVRKISSLKNVLDDQMLKDAEDKKGSKSKDPFEESRQILKMLLAGGADMNACFEALESILLSCRNNDKRYAYLDNNIALTDTLIEEFDIYDMKMILCLYIENFIAFSPGL